MTVSGHSTADLLRLVVAAFGGDERPGQVTMADAVADALANERQALIQAGTGTGKSLAYLVPAVVQAVQTESRIVISTATLALQRQVMNHDLPLVLETLESVLGTRPMVALLKGRANYLCRYRVTGGYPEPDDYLDFGGYSPVSTLGREMARLTAWADETTTGDRDDLEPGVSSLAWGRVSVSGRECLATACPKVNDCFAETSIAKARISGIVVTNHAMLAIEATSHDVLGHRDGLIVDEAHELVSRITSGATKELTAHRIETAGRAARRCGVTTTHLDEVARTFEGILAGLRVGRLASGLPETLAGSLTGLREAARGVAREVEASRDKGEALAKMADAALLEIVDLADAVLNDPKHLVLWLAPPEGDYRGSVPGRLLAAPLDVAGLVRSRLVADGAAIFTSATLALGGSFEAMANQLGVEDPMTLDAGSPFDYPNQGVLYIASHLDRPGTGGIGADALEELAALIEAAGGRTLGLFSSHRAAQDATEAMRERLDLPILYQRDDQVPTLLARFRQDPRACLFGSTTLWQGVDLPGETCQLVVIDRIPFPRPDDPIAQARAEAIESQGGNGFMAVSATHAALLLAQGAGRLIRTLTDRGVVAVLDSRLATARYGGFLLRSLPGLVPTTDRVAVLETLRRLDKQDEEEGHGSEGS